MGDLTFYIDLEDSSGTKYGSGPITSASGWTYTARMDKAGEFSFTLPATDPNADQVQRKRIVRAWALVGGVWTDVGAGIVDNIVRTPQADGTVLLRVSGADLLRELTYRSVHTLQLMSGNAAITHTAALTAIGALAPSGWTFTPAATPPNDEIYGQYSGETVLAALIALADKTETHLYRGAGRTVIFDDAFTASGVRAIQAGPGDLADETCAITGLTETVDTHDLVTRIYPRGAGNGAVQLDLTATTRTAPSGYTLSKASGYIERAASTTAYGLIESYVEWRDIAPVENTTADIRAAANMLFDEALRELTRRSETTETPYYQVSLAGCSELLRPMQTLRVSYRDVEAGLTIEADLNILETTWSVGVDGVQTTAATVTTSDRWAQSDTAAIVESMAQGRIYQALPQMNANEYVTSFNKNVDSDNTATFRFRFSHAVTALRWAYFEFQILPFESTVKTVALLSETGGSGELITDPATGATGAAADANNVSGTPSTDTSGAPSSDTSGGPSSDTSGTPSTDTSGGPSTDETGAPDGGDVISAGRHDHTATLVDDSTGVAVKALSMGSGQYILQAATGAGNGYIKVIASGNHTHDLSAHTHTLGGHTHTLGAHTHTLGGHTHTLGGHTHSLGGHTHSLNNHTHTLTPEIETIYGIFRETAGNTYALSQLQYRVNSGAWAAMSTAESLSGGWYRLDIADAIRDSDTLRPTADSNTVEVRGVVSVTIAEISSNIALFVNLLVETTTPHGAQAGDRVTISGTTNFNGSYVVDSIGLPAETSTTLVLVYDSAITATETSGTLTLAKTATIDAQLAIHSTIQPIYI